MARILIRLVVSLKRDSAENGSYVVQTTASKTGNSLRREATINLAIESRLVRAAHLHGLAAANLHKARTYPCGVWGIVEAPFCIAMSPRGITASAERIGEKRRAVVSTKIRIGVA